MKRNITDRWLELKRAEAGLHWDKSGDGFGVRVSLTTGRKVFLLNTRYKRGGHPAPRALGKYPELTLEEARRGLREWLKLIKRGVDPQLAEKQAREAEERKGRTLSVPSLRTSSPRSWARRLSARMLMARTSRPTRSARVGR